MMNLLNTFCDNTGYNEMLTKWQNQQEVDVVKVYMDTFLQHPLLVDFAIL